MIKTLLKGVLRRFGYELRKKPEIGFTASYLSRICNPRTVIDVGVANGTVALHNAFPKAKFVLIEPLREYEDSINRLCTKYDCDVHYKAVAESPGTVEFNVDAGNLEKSSFSSRATQNDKYNRLERRLVEVTTLDALYLQNPDIQRPILLKIDTEGHELSVLEGATHLLPAVDFVIAESSIARRFENGYEFKDIVWFMDKSGFDVFSLLTVESLRGEDRQRFADVLFKRRGAASAL
jgi:FkbM family methyltransferase